MLFEHDRAGILARRFKTDGYCVCVLQLETVGKYARPA